MKRFIAAVIAAGAFAFAIALPLALAFPAHATGGVYVNNGQVCAAGASMDLTATGDVAIVCASVTVTQPPPVTNTCSGPIAGTFASTTVDSALTSIASSGVASYKLPVWTAAGKSQIFNGVNSANPGVAGLTAQFSVSTCPGDFDSVPAACKVTGSPENGAIQLSTRSVAAPSTAGCALVTGQQYYFNVRNLNCTAGVCSEIVQMHGG